MASFIISNASRSPFTVHIEGHGFWAVERLTRAGNWEAGHEH
ncbi:hypothetical protein [Paracoccus sp. J56]|nr:hypothetical protein [Paracoccus sp. J56]SMG55834.1 hypothetical protein SAMN02746000_03757 [Paracoccus sp. J56]